MSLSTRHRAIFLVFALIFSTSAPAFEIREVASYPMEDGVDFIAPVAGGGITAASRDGQTLLVDAMGKLRKWKAGNLDFRPTVLPDGTVLTVSDGSLVVVKGSQERRFELRHADVPCFLGATADGGFHVAGKRGIDVLSPQGSIVASYNLGSDCWHSPVVALRNGELLAAIGGNAHLLDPKMGSQSALPLVIDWGARPTATPALLADGTVAIGYSAQYEKDVFFMGEGGTVRGKFEVPDQREQIIRGPIAQADGTALLLTADFIHPQSGVNEMKFGFYYINSRGKLRRSFHLSTKGRGTGNGTILCAPAIAADGTIAAFGPDGLHIFGKNHGLRASYFGDSAGCPAVLPNGTAILTTQSPNASVLFIGKDGKVRGRYVLPDWVSFAWRVVPLSNTRVAVGTDGSGVGALHVLETSGE